MENEYEEVITHETDTDTTENDTDNNDSESAEELAALRKELATTKAQKEHWRAKASEKKETSSKTEESTINPKDMYAMMQANVHEEDIDTVTKYAQFENISIADALKSDVVKTILSNKAEYRKTAEVTNTTAARRSTTKATDETLMSNLSKGVVPESKDEAERIFWARRGGKR